MIRNEKGFILPVTIMVSLFFFFVLAHEVTTFLIKSKFYKETEELYILENLMALGVTDGTLELNNNQRVSKEYTYPHGTCTIASTPVDINRSKVNITCKTIENRLYIGQFTYDFQQQKAYGWMEYR